MANIADLAGEAASLPAATVSLPFFPSSAGIIRGDEFRELRLALLQLVEQERAHVDTSKYDRVLAILWSDGANSFRQRFAQWEPNRQKRNIRERVAALINHFSSFTSAEPSEIEWIAKRLKVEMDKHTASNIMRPK